MSRTPQTPEEIKKERRERWTRNIVWVVLLSLSISFWVWVVWGIKSIIK